MLGGAGAGAPRAAGGARRFADELRARLSCAPWQELRKVCDDEGIDTKGLVEKEEYVKKIKAHFNIKDEV